MSTVCQIVTYLVLYIVFLIGSSIISSCVILIPSGYVGVKSRLGKIQAAPQPPGLSFINPFLDRVTIEDVKLWSVSTTAAAATKASQEVNVEVSVQYVLRPDLVPTMHMKIGERSTLEPKIFSPALNEGIKQIVPRYASTEVLINRDQVKEEIYANIKKIIQETLANDSSQSQDDALDLTELIQFSNVAIRDFRFSDSYNQIIEDKMRTEQEKEMEKHIKAKQLVIADGQAVQQKTLADAAAYAIKVEADARADGLKKHADALKAYQASKSSGSYADLEATKKWNGHLPEIYGEGSVSPLALMNTENNSRKKRDAKRRLKRAVNFVKGFFSQDPVTVAHRENFVSDYHPTQTEIDAFIQKNYPILTSL